LEIDECPGTKSQTCELWEQWVRGGDFVKGLILSEKSGETLKQGNVSAGSSRTDRHGICHFGSFILEELGELSDGK
jgi:hypothetical protein